MSTKNFCEFVVKATKYSGCINSCKHFKCKILIPKNPYNPKMAVLSQKQWKNGSTLNTHKAQLNAIKSLLTLKKSRKI